MCFVFVLCITWGIFFFLFTQNTINQFCKLQFWRLLSFPKSMQALISVDCDLGSLVVLSISFIIHRSVRKGETISVYAICLRTVYAPVCHLPFPAGHAGSGMQLLEYANQIVPITLSFLRRMSLEQAQQHFFKVIQKFPQGLKSLTSSQSE